jgi:hypothetical protein
MFCLRHATCFDHRYCFMTNYIQSMAICRYDPLVLKLNVWTVVVVRCCCHLDLWERLCGAFHVRSFICSTMNGDEEFWRSGSAVPMGIHRPLRASFCSLKFNFFFFFVVTVILGKMLTWWSRERNGLISGLVGRYAAALSTQDLVLILRGVWRHGGGEKPLRVI